MTESSRPTPVRSEATKLQDRVLALVLAGCALTIATIVFGIAMAFKATRIECPDGTITYGPGPARCFAHHQAGEGAAVALLGAILLVILLLVAVVADSVAKSRKAAEIAQMLSA